LTDFIPATVDKVSIKLNLLLDQKDRLESLSNAINNSGFLTTISLSEPVLATAKALGKASRCILDAFLEAETKKPILEFTGDFNVGTPDLRSGYHVFLATTDKGSPLPAHDAHYSVEGTTLLVDQQPATRWSYVILEVMCSEARDRNPQANWDKLLREAEAAASEFARNAAFLDANQMKAKQKAAVDKCQALITKAETLLQADPNYVSEERSRIIAASFKDYTDKITGIATTRRYGAPASRVHNRRISDARLALGLPKDAELNQVLLRYAEQVQGFRLAETTRAKKDQQADDVRRKIEESDRVALGNDVTAITPGATLV
jgi:hypothetical protein